MTNPMVSLLTDNKLNGSKFPKWKENIYIALIGENAIFVLTERSPEQPGENATKAVKEKFEQILNQLTELFGMASINSRFEATRNFINAWMNPHQNVRDHLLKMASYFQEAQNHGAVMDQTTQVSLILNSLTPAFLPYTSNYVMNKNELEFHEFVNNLQTFENFIGGPQKKGSKTPNSRNANGAAKAELQLLELGCYPSELNRMVGQMGEDSPRSR
ncbi:uncharacterized protein LOC133036892 [Cannabis sativa]|uniref:uncharacterized protein LOC133036892 n=1 Tax=Cannabis sativa TaxID=3483 RepID=UPI0029C9DB72|nr:uncharacterized protein LOC133036892 [Cannabis sativa]